MKGIFSPCGNYRHLLSEGEGIACGWVMLNPSVAGSTEAPEDPTARRVRGFSKDWGYASWCIANVYDKIATNPLDLWRGEVPPISPDNAAYLAAVASLPLVVIACGRNARRADLQTVEKLLRRLGADLFCLGFNEDRSPKHPLYLPYTAKLIRWPGLL